MARTPHTLNPNAKDGTHDDPSARSASQGGAGERNAQGHMGHAQGTNFHTLPGDLHSTWRRLIAECLGTFLLTLVAAGAAVIGTAAGQPMSLPVKVVAPALIVLALIYTLGDVSGAHLNPAVTLAFTLRRDFPVREVPGYWLAQLIGATLAAIFLRMTFGDVAALGATLPNPKLGPVPAVIMEFVLTSILVLVILGTAHHHRIVGHNAAFAVSATIACTGLFAATVSGASMNPARSFGPALIGGTLQYMWIYVLGPMAGAILACALEWGLNGSPTAEAQKAAQGGHEG